MLTRHRAPSRGSALVIVMAVAALLGLLTMAAFHLVLDQRRRGSLADDHALAKRGAERALMAAECDLSAATAMPTTNTCHAKPLPALRVALDPLTLAGFTPGACSDGPVRGLCQPLPGQSLWALAGLLDAASHAKEIDADLASGERLAARRPRYVIEPIPDALPGGWMHAGAAAQASLFRITAAGFGADPDISVVLQTVFRPRAYGG